MINDVCYHQPCPVCGRSLRIGVALLGRRVYCQHCGGGFVAADPATAGPGPAAATAEDRDATVDRLLEEAARLLAQASR